MMGDAEGALKDLDRVLELEPRHFEALFTKGAILEELKRPREAMAAYEAALAVWPGMGPAKRALHRLRLELDQET
jgi:tetratricopeptide (TPR) repeat protein